MEQSHLVECKQAQMFRLKQICNLKAHMHSTCNESSGLKGKVIASVGCKDGKGEC